MCGNGYGHFKRCAKIANYLISNHQDVSVNFVCNENIIKENYDWIILKELYEFSNFNLISTKKRVRINNNKINFKDLFNDDFLWIDKTIISKTDLMISDNCTSILKYRPDTILMGSFLWSEVFSVYAVNNIEIQKCCNHELDLLIKHKPQMISLKDMSMPYVKNYTNVFYTDWLVTNRNLTLIKKRIRNILILGGGTGLVDEIILKMVNLLQSKFNVYSNEKIVNKSFTNKIIINKFDFTADSFNNIDLIIARPGIGTLTDSVTYGIPIFGISESIMVNKEIQFNLKKIENLKIGLDISSNPEDILNIILKIQENDQYFEFQNNLINRGIDGIAQTVNLIIKKLDEKRYNK